MKPGLRSVLVAVVVGGTLLVLVPSYLMESRGVAAVAAVPQAALGCVLVLVGLLVVFWSARELAVRGRGTPNPLDCGRRLRRDPSPRGRPRGARPPASIWRGLRRLQPPGGALDPTRGGAVRPCSTQRLGRTRPLAALD